MPAVDEEAARAKSRDTTFPRIVQPYTVEGNARGDAAPISLMVSSYLEELTKEVAHALRALLIEVMPGDGMSTLVQEVASAAESVDGTAFAVLKGNSDRDLPELTDAVGPRKLRAAARRAGLLGTGRGSSRLTTAGMVLAAILLAVLGLLLTSWVKNATPVTNDLGAFLDPSFLVVVVVAGVLPIVTKRVWEQIGQRRVTSELLAERIRGATPEQMDALVTTLVEDFASITQPRCVVVDDFATLDECTRRFVREYLERFGLSDRRPELWVVTENTITQGRGALWLDVLAASRRRTRSGLARTRLNKLENLTENQRRQLAEEVGYPERARFVTVRAITAQSMLSYDSIFDEAATRDRQSGAYTQLDLIHVLACTATCGGNLRWREATLIHALESKRNLRSAVLQTLLPKGSLRRSEIVPRLNQLRSAFAPVIRSEGVDQPASLLVDFEAARALEACWRERKLSSPGRVHLFWSLHWYEARRDRPDDAFYVDKLARHLIAAGLPGEYADLSAHVAGIHQTLFEALDLTVHACLKTGQIDHVPSLIDKAGTVVKADESPGAERRRRRLLRLAWDVHGLLGDDHVLVTIDEVAALAEPDESGEARQASRTGDLFEDPFGERSVLTRTQGALSLPDRQTLRLVEDYGFFQDSWMAVALAPFGGGATKTLNDAVATRRESVAARVRALLAEREDVAESWAALEQATMSLALWCWSLSERHEGFADCLISAYYVTDELRAARDAVHSGEAVDLVLDGLAEELQITVATAGLMALALLMLKERQRDDDLEMVTNEALSGLGLWKGSPLSDRTWVVAAGKASAKRMALLEVTWRSLGFSYLSAMLGLRRVHFESVMAKLAGDDDPSARLEGWRGITDELDRPGRRGVLAGIVVAGMLSSDEVLAATHLLRVATLALDSTMRDDLATQLCLVALCHSHSYGFDEGRAVIAYLVQPDDSGHSRLQVLLDRTPDEYVGDVVNWLLNSLGKPPDEQSAAAVIAAVRARAAAMGLDNTHREEIETGIEVFELRQAVRSGVEIDVNEVLRHWEPRRERPSYPFVLYLVLDREHLASRYLASEIALVIKGFLPYLSSSGILLLGHRITSLSWPPEHHDLMTMDDVVLMLEVGFPLWDGMLSPDVSQDILSVLLQREHGRREWYLQRRSHWHEVEQEVAEKRRLPSWLSEGKYAVLLESYWRLLVDYGVVAGPAGLSATDIATEGAGGEADVPDPFVERYGKRMVNLEFIREVRVAFFAEADRNDFADRRLELDRVAQKSLLPFFSVLADADDVPASIKSILARHARLVQRRLAPSDTERIETV